MQCNASAALQLQCGNTRCPCITTAYRCTGAINNPARVLNALAAKLPEQAELRRQRQQQQQQKQQQQQRLPKGQLPPDQQTELDNSLNTLGLVLLQLWLLGCSGANELLQLRREGDTVRVETLVGLSMRCSRQHACVAQHVELMLLCWPKVDASDNNAYRSSSSSSNSSRSEPVRYGKLVLPRLPQVTYADALPVALAAAQQLAVFNDAVQLVLPADTQPVQLESNAEGLGAIGPALHDARGDMADRALLAVQLLLLACQAKVHFIEVAGKQLRRSLVPNLTPHGLPLPPPPPPQQQSEQQQEQQVQQPIAAAKPEYLRLQDHHDLLLESYGCKNTDIVAILGQQQEELQSSM
jgi:hypothetical protein